MSSGKPMKQKQEMDLLVISKNLKIVKHLDPGQFVLFSSTIIKINKVGKRQERILVITDRHVLNIAPPSSFFAYRIKRIMLLVQISGVSLSSANGELCIHMNCEDDYRFISVHFSKRIIEILAASYSRLVNSPLKIYEYNEASLQPYTTTKRQLKKGERKQPAVLPKLLDEQKIINSSLSKLVLKYEKVTAVEQIEQFDLIKVLGRGGFGKIMLCRNKLNLELYAVKVLVLSQLKDESDLKKILSERELIAKTHHPFLVQLKYAFVSAEKIYLVMDYCRGGDLYQRLRKDTYFSESRAKFYAAQVFLALKEIHALGYVYRDLKPENILIQANGYIKLADFGLALKLEKGEKVFSNAGTRCYLSPEVLRKQNITQAVDWWAFGTLLFQMLYGRPPFLSQNQQQMYQWILYNQPYFSSKRMISEELKDLISKLLVKDPLIRLGNQGDDDIRNHAWFKKVEWQKLIKQELPPEYVPPNEQQCSEESTERPVDSITPCDLQKISRFRGLLQSFEYSPQLYRKFYSKTNPENFFSPKKQETSDSSRVKEDCLLLGKYCSLKEDKSSLSGKHCLLKEEKNPHNHQNSLLTEDK